MPTESTTIGSIAEFTKFVEAHEQGVTLLFRGQSQAFPLLPYIARFKPNPNLVPLRIAGQPDLLVAEERMIVDFKKLSLPLLVTPPDNDWDWLALAQHHGLPTRLLDWSKSGLAALWFAVREPAKLDDEGVPQDGVIWIYKPERVDYANRDEYHERDPFKTDRISVIRPNHFSNRIVAQSGLFTVHPSRDTAPHFVAFEDDDRHVGTLKKLVIPHDRFHSLRFNLNRMGVNNFSLFPDLDGLCDYLYWTRSLDSDSPFTTKLPEKERWVDEL